MFKIDLHTHTIASKDALNTVYEMAREAQEKGIELLALTEHGPKNPCGPPLNYFVTSVKIPRKIFGLEILMGCETNIMDLQGGLDLVGRTATSQDIILAGIHMNAGITPTSEEEHTKAVLGAMGNPYTDIITHPYQARVRIDMEKVVAESYERQIPLEINCTHIGYIEKEKAVIEEVAKMIELVKDYKWSLVVTSDAHIASQIGDDSILERLNLRELLVDDIILNKSVEDVKQFLKERREKRPKL